MAVNKFLEKSFYTVRETKKTITEEEAHYLRIINLLLRVAPQAVRVQFDKEFFPGGLQKVLNQNKFKVLDSLKKKRVINQKQWDLLYPRTGVASSNSFDLTLMICLIRNLTKISVGDLLPLPIDMSVGADLSRMKHYRNLVAHCDDGTLSNQEFQDIWTEISLAAVRLGGMNFQQKCNDLKVSTLDKNDIEILNEFRNIDRSNNPISKGFQEVLTNIAEGWKVLDEKVVETSAIQHLKQLATTADIITVIGSPGCGKSTAMYHLALEWHLHQDYDIIYSHTPIDLRNYYNPDRKQIFIFDDVYGKYILEQPKKEAWSSLSTEINMILKNKTVKICFSCRTHIYNQIEKDSDVICKTVCNLLSDELILTVDERVLIAEKYIPAYTVASLKKTEHFNRYDFFPLLCKLSTNKLSKDIEKLFSRPVEFVRQDLHCMMKLNDQTTVATLFLFVIYNNCLTKDLLASKSEIRNILQDLSEEFKIPFVFSIKIVKQQFEFLMQSYVIETDKIYKVIHDKIFDIMISFFGQYMIDLVIDYAHSDLIRDRFQFESIAAPESENMIIVSDEKEGNYFERLCTDVKKGNIENVFLNHQLQYKLFTTKLISWFEKNKADLAGPMSMYSNKKSSPLLIMTKQGYCDMIRMLIDLNLNIDVCDEYRRTPLFIACWDGNVDVVDLLLRNKCNPNLCSKYGMSPLYVASWMGFSPIVKLLLESKCNMNIVEYKKWNPLHIASNLGYNSIVELLLQHNCFHNDCIFDLKSPFCITILKKHLQLVLQILRPTCCSDTCNKYNRRSELSIVLHKIHTVIFRSIVNLLNEKNSVDLVQYFESDYIYADVLTLLSLHKCYDVCRDNIFREYKLSFLVSIAYGYEDAVSLFLKDSIHEGFFSKDKTSPLMLAFENENILNMLLENDFLHTCKAHKQLLCKAASHGYVKTVKLLLQCNVNPNVCNTIGESPLNLAIEHDNIDIVKLLIDNKADPNRTDKYNQSPLHIAVKSDDVDIVKLLIQNKADPNKLNNYKQSPLHIAIKYNKIKSATLLLAYGCDINLYNEVDGFPLHLAITYDNLDIVKLLIQNNADPNVLDKYGQSPLHIAVQYNKVEIAELLLEHGCDTRLYNNYGESPFDLARKSRNLDIINLLIRNKADPYKYGQSPSFFERYIRKGTVTLCFLFLSFWGIFFYLIFK